MNEQNLHAIEKFIAQAWPAETEENYNDWILRANAGVTKRANSVYSIGDIPSSQNWLKDIELFYTRQAIMPCFYISELSAPDLDSFLYVQGYEKTGEMFLMEQLCKATTSPQKYQVEIELAATPAWIRNFLQLEGFSPDSYTAYGNIFSNITLHKAFISLYHEADVVALGTIVVKEKQAYLSNIVVHERIRRQGVAYILMQELANYAHEHGVEKIYLQVLQDNLPAIRLYEKCGFKRIAASHYRMKKASLPSLK